MLAVIALAPFIKSGMGLEEWFRHPWNENGEGQELEIVWSFLFIGAMTKDFFAGLSWLILLHHVVAIIVGTTFLFVSPPGLCMGGVSIMELGSATFAANILYPDSKRIRWMNGITMTLSNMFGVWCAW